MTIHSTLPKIPKPHQLEASTPSFCPAQALTLKLLHSRSPHRIQVCSQCMSSHLGTLHAHLPKSLSQLKQLHAQIISHPLHGHHNYWLSTLLAHCVRLRAPLSYARHLFDSMPHPSPHCFTAMARLYSQLGTHHEVVALYAQMRRRDLTPEPSIFPILIKSLGSDTVAAHAHVLKSGHASNCYVRNAILNFYAQHGPIDIAKRVFDEMPDRTIADWNSMLSGYWKSGCKEEALSMFASMPERNVISWTVMVTGLSRVGELERARRFFDEMPERTVVSWNAMLSGYTQNGQADKGLRLFDQMMDVGLRPNETTWVAVISACSSKGDLGVAESLVGSLKEKEIHLNCFIRTALIDMYAKCGSLAKAKQIFDDMKDQSLVTWNAMITAYTREGDLPRAKELFEMMPAKDVVSWNSMITGYVQNGQWSMAIELFKEMVVVKKLRPDEVTISSVISACGNLGALEFGRWVADFITRNRIGLSISVYNSLIFMYSRSGSMEDAKRVFQEMPARDIFSYNSLISGFASLGNGRAVLDLIESMEKESIEPDDITHIGILTACSRAGLSEEGLKAFYSIKLPTVDHYACMVDLLGRAGRLEEAKQVIKDMPVKPHAGVYGALLNASRIHRCVEPGEFAARELFELEPENSGNYVLLSNIYASAGRWKDVEHVRKIMRGRGVSKMIGCSWVEFGGEVHRFVAGDRSHCRSVEIYRVLKEVRKKMKALGYVADKNCVTRDVEEEEKEEMVETHSEKLAVGFGLLVLEAGAVIRVVKNLRICEDCHSSIKMISEIEGREIVVRDNNRFHCFKGGRCSCKDFW